MKEGNKKQINVPAHSTLCACTGKVFLYGNTYHGMSVSITWDGREAWSEFFVCVCAITIEWETVI